MVIEKDKEIEVNENRKRVSDKIIGNLQNEKDDLKKELKAVNLKKDERLAEIDTFRIQLEKKKSSFISQKEDHIQELENKIKEMHTRKLMNEKLIEDTLNEKEGLKVSLVALEKENSELKELAQNEPDNKTEVQSLGDELEFDDQYSQNKNFKCSICDRTFPILGWYNSHMMEHKREDISAWKSREDEISKQTCKLKLKVSSDLLELREAEISDSIRCKCKGYCHIYHHKHNWKTSHAQKLIEKLDAVISEEKKYSCKSCVKTFLNVEDLREHDKNDHQKKNPTEENQAESQVINKREIRCNDCNVAFKSKKKLKKHRTRAHRSKCEDCQKDFVSSSALKQHIESDHAENKTKDYLIEPEVIVQKEVTDDEDETAFFSTLKCEICRIFLPTSKALEEHFDTIHLEDIKCGYCRIEFQAIREMDLHMDLKHKGLWKLNDPDILREGDSEFDDEFEED